MANQPTIPFYKLHPREAKAAAVAVMNLAPPFLESGNSFFTDFVTHLKEKTEKLSAAIAKSDGVDLTKKARDDDMAFNVSFRDFRELVELKARMKSLGNEGLSCGVLFKSVQDFGGAIEEMPREVQIVTTDELIHSWEHDPEMQKHLDTGNVRTSYEAFSDDHDTLKKTELKRSSLSSDLGEIPSEWDAGREVKPILSIIYNHIQDYADFGKEGYGKLLADINAELAPIVVQVRARDTRNKSDDEVQE